MRKISFPLWAIGLALGAVLLAAACGEEKTGPVEPISLVLSAGNDQCAPAGTALPQPLEVTLVGSDEEPFPGATVRWKVESGGGSLVPDSNTTNALGRAQASWTLGASAGRHDATASVGGLPPVAFTATALEAPSAETPYTPNSVVTGALASTDCRLSDGRFVDFYRFPSPVQTYRFTLAASALDPFLFLYDGDRNLVALNDDVTDSTSAVRIFLAAGEYVAGASSSTPGEVGAYTLASAATGEEVGACEEVWVTRGVQTAQAVSAADCELFFQGDGPFYSDQFRVWLEAGDSLTVTMRSDTFDAFLVLFDSTQTVVGLDDDGGGDLDALLRFLARTAGVYTIDAGTAFARDTGLYNLSVR